MFLTGSIADHTIHLGCNTFAERTDHSHHHHGHGYHHHHTPDTDDATPATDDAAMDSADKDTSSMHTNFEDYFNNKYDKPATNDKKPEADQDAIEESDSIQESSETSPEDSVIEDEKTDVKTPSPYTAGTYYDPNIVDN